MKDNIPLSAVQSVKEGAYQCYHNITKNALID